MHRQDHQRHIHHAVLELAHEIAGLRFVEDELDAGEALVVSREGRRDHRRGETRGRADGEVKVLVDDDESHADGEDGVAEVRQWRRWRW